MKKLFSLLLTLCLVLLLLPAAVNAESIPGGIGVTITCSQSASGAVKAPVEITSVNKEDSGKPYIDWDKSEAAVEYWVYRAASKDGSYKKIKSTTKTAYTDKDAAAGKKYYYKVKAVNARGETSSYSDYTAITCDLPQPVIASAQTTVSTGKPKVKWSAVEDAVEYAVYRKVSGGSYSKIGNTTKNYYTDKTADAGTKYYYKVKAICANTSGNSAYSAAKACTCDLAQPTVSLSNTASSGKCKLKWSEVSDASKYYVYRAVSKDGDYEKIKSTSATSFTDSDAKVGNKYYYMVKAIHENTSANSAYSAPVSGTRDLARPNASVKLSSGKPKLSWDKISKASKYYIYRAASESGEYEKIGSTTSTSYTDKTVKSDKTYYYKVKAVYSDNTSANSAYSSVVKIKVKAVETNTEIKFLSYPETISRNEIGTVEIQGKPNTEYKITVYYKSGASTADGLEAKISDDDGYVSWTWKVGGRTSAGTFKIVVSGGGDSKTVNFTVVE